MIRINDKEYTTFIFDFDGVILDTEKYHFKAWNLALKEYQLALKEEEYEPLKSTGREHVLHFLEEQYSFNLSQDEKEELFAKKEQYYLELIENISKNDFIPGIELFLEILRKNHNKLAVASSSVLAKKVAQKLSLDQCFDVFIDSSNNIKKKPSPDLFNLAVTKMQVNKDECLIFEDSLAGFQSAINANIDFISVGSLKDEKEIMHVQNFNDLLSLIKESL